MLRDEKYITLKKIAEVLEENYSTIRHYKRRFNVYLDARVFGRQVRYSTQNIELFREILDFKEDGYTNDDVEAVLMDKKIIRQGDNEVMEQSDKEVSEQVSQQAGEGVSKQVSKQVGQEVSGQSDEEVSQKVSGQAGNQVSEEVGEQVSKGVSKQEVKEIYQAVYKEIKAGVYTETQSYFERLVQSLEANLNDHLRSLTENISTSLAMLNENQQTLHKAITQVNERVVSMESELGLESVEEHQIGCLKTGDLKNNVGELALDLPLMEETIHGEEGPNLDQDSYQDEDPTQCPTLEKVLKSITNGVSDKVAVVQWLSTMRSKTKVDPMSRPISSFFKLHLKFNLPDRIPFFCVKYSLL